MMMTISILVFILFLCCTVFLKGSLLGGILGMALAAGAAALAVLRRRYPQKKLATAGCVLLIAVAAGTGLLFPASGLSEESPAENPLIAQLTEAALSGDLIEGDRLAAEYTAGREKDIAENGAPEFLPRAKSPSHGNTVHFADVRGLYIHRGVPYIHRRTGFHA